VSSLRTPSFTGLPSRSIVFRAGGGRFMPAESFSTHRFLGKCSYEHHWRSGLNAGEATSDGVLSLSFTLVQPVIRCCHSRPVAGCFSGE
jgi:hypothetical protein